MTIALKSIVKCEVIDKMKIFKALVLAMLFLRHVNMLWLMKRFAKTFDLFLSSMHNQIWKNVTFGLKIKEG